jgi:hypothetical protein
MSKYIGLTYPKILSWKPILFLWKKFFCNKNMHLFDEVFSEKHYLYCDACGFCINVTV